MHMNINRNLTYKYLKKKMYFALFVVFILRAQYWRYFSALLRAITVNLLLFTIISVAMNCSASFSFRVQMRLVSAVTLVEGGNQNSSLQAVALHVRLYMSCKLTPSIKSSEIWESKNDSIHILKFYAFSLLVL